MLVILGYSLTGLNYILYCTSRFCKEKKNMLLLDIFAKIVTIISFICLNSYTGVGVMIIQLILLFVAHCKETHTINKKLSISIFVGFMLMYLANAIFTYNGIASSLVTLTGILCMIGIWWLKPQNMRKLGLLISVIYLIFQISIKNWAGLLEICVLIANATSLIKYRKQSV